MGFALASLWFLEVWIAWYWMLTAINGFRGSQNTCKKMQKLSLSSQAEYGKSVVTSSTFKGNHGYLGCLSMFPLDQLRDACKCLQMANLFKLQRCTTAV